jgi:Spy/CpxP family protein refolding chaperone
MSAFTNLVVGIVLVAAVSPAIRVAAMAPANNAPADSEAAYTKSINDRADKIVATLDIDDADKRTRVRDQIAAQYRTLRDIHDARDAKLAQAKESPGGDRTIVDAWVKVARDTADRQLDESHRRFVARLSTELTPEQVEKVKDGLTYNVVRITYDRYLELLPTLHDSQRREVLANLIEAREYAMDAGSSEEKHAIFGKYKGRINNYLSAQGFDLKAAEKELATRQKAAAPDRSR